MKLNDESNTQEYALLQMEVDFSDLLDINLLK